MLKQVSRLDTHPVSVVCLGDVASLDRACSTQSVHHNIVKGAVSDVSKDDPISPSQLLAYDGSDPSKPIYVAIKGRVFDVSAKKEMYGKGAGYNVFAGKDASKGLGELATNR